MNFPNDSGVKTNVSLACATRRPAARPQVWSISPSGALDALDRPGTMMPVNSSGAGTAQEAGEQGDIWRRGAEDPKSNRADSHEFKSSKAKLGWLGRDPSEWVGRKVLNRKTGKVYVVKTVYINGRVELEKSWMTYSFYVWTIRADFETYS